MGLSDSDDLLWLPERDTVPGVELLQGLARDPHTVAAVDYLETAVKGEEAHLVEHLPRY